MWTPRTLLQLWLQGLSYLNGGVLTEGQGRWVTEVLNPMAHVHAGAPSLAVNTGGIRRPRSQGLPFACGGLTSVVVLAEACNLHHPC